jgi:hypothetical protein
MATVKSTSVETLAKLRAERASFEKREREARRDAAIELGEAVLKTADLALSPAQLSELIQAAMKHGFDGALARLTPEIAVRKTAANGGPGEVSEHVS